MLVILTATTGTGIMFVLVQMENAWLTGQPRATSPFHTILRMPLGRWNTGAYSDLAFASAGFGSLQLDGRILEKFPRSQH